ncbi:TetR/AcrR family transcriptional regulator [Salinibacterium sp. ZJ454]|uniref:TetR/AcrR family transcriptional regulator n=1 Tax=Salinibacterium sp. ZJ454 TaxID=2708339 RepID=UPI0014204F4F|nr:TetR/AcrR family transcriptional regulator [Salinibacterium sp. ZJ454]
MATIDHLRSVALDEFSRAGYLGTSVARIAELAGVSKSSVLYHYASKEALLDAAIGPALDGIEQILERVRRGAIDDSFVEEFVDFLLRYRLEVNIFINQRRSLVDVPVIERANALVVRLAQYFGESSTSVEDRMRFGIALGGAAYCLATAEDFSPDPHSDEQVRGVLIDILSDLLTPVHTQRD